MRLSILVLSMTVLLGGASQQDNKQQDNKKATFDPFADPAEELIKRAEKSQKEKRYGELKAAAAELKELSVKMSDELEAGDKDVISAKLWSNLDRAEKLIKTMREKAK
jgi:cytochrome c556